ncbi:hypothetical protein [Syntrophomonas wolfei]|jgi:hypothetical protein|nr:hypothetical protein [Syntrophomonas wolfei]
MCFLWINIDDKPWQEYTDEYRRNEEKPDNVKVSSSEQFALD